jgi:hypothetical protein
MLPRHSGYQTLFFVANYSLYLHALDILVRRRVSVVASDSPFLTCRLVLDSFTLLRYLIDELMVWTRGLGLPLP